MPRNRRGSLWEDRQGNVYGRVTFTDEHGKRCDRKRKALTGTKKEAWGHVADMLNEIGEHGEKALDGARVTFNDLAAYYEAHELIPPTYDDEGKKRTGLRTYIDYRRKLKVHTDKFGPRRIRGITYKELKEWRAERLATPTRNDSHRHKKALESDENAPLLCTRTVATVNREMTVLHRAFVIAFQNRWVLRNPFDDGGSLFDATGERERERIADDDEEERLLSFCVDKRAHLRPFVICAFDTGMRAGEIYRLEPHMVNFATHEVLAVSYKGNRRKERPFTMTPRLEEEMKTLVEGRVFKPGETIFKHKNCKRALSTARRLAGLQGFRLHDIRHTTATRLVNGDMNLTQVGKLLGHSNPKTTWRYVHADRETQDRAAEILSRPKKKKD